MVKLGDYAVTITSDMAGGVVKEADDGVVELRDQTEYKVQLTNNSDRRCAAELRIDGIYMGLFMVNAHSSWAIERPDSDSCAKVFRFDAVGGSNAGRAGAVAGASSNGLVTVAFTPEKPKPIPIEVPRYHRRVVGPYLERARKSSTGFGGRAAAATRDFAAYSDDAEGDEYYDDIAVPQSAALPLAFGGAVAPPPPPAPPAARREGVTTLGRASSQHFSDVTDGFEGVYEETVTIHVRLAVVAPAAATEVTPLSAVRGPRATTVPPPIPSFPPPGYYAEPVLPAYTRF